MITSKQNNSYKLWTKLRLKKYRDQSGLFLVYGKHLIEEAKKHQALVEILTSNVDSQDTVLSKELMDGLQQAETYFDEIGVCKKTNIQIKSDRVLILDDVQDPDNLGALMRSASAFGFLHMMISHQSADIYNEKTIRASKGSIFNVYVERKPLKEAVVHLKNLGYKIIYADAHNKGSIDKVDKLALILGNEGHGVSEDLRMLADQAVTIETKNVESLNVSVAGGILMYEWRNI